MVANFVGSGEVFGAQLSIFGSNNVSSSTAAKFCSSGFKLANKLLLHSANQSVTLKARCKVSPGNLLEGFCASHSFVAFIKKEIAST